MTNKTTRIGRREVLLDDLKQAVAQANSPKEVCKNLGFNNTVATTINAIKEAISHSGIDMTHFKPAYTVSEKVKNRARIRQFKLNSDNTEYYVAFQRATNPTSWSTYKASIGNFMEGLGDLDFAAVSVDEILSFVGDKENRSSHLKSLMLFIVNNNVNNSAEKVKKDVLLWMLNEIQPKTLISDPVFPDEIESASEIFIEGFVGSAKINLHERNPAARRKCLDHYGMTCSVCGNDLGEVYGDVFSGMIHVHHIIPISKYNNEHDVDPIRDLRPVCPNCHMIIHCRKENPYTIEEVQSFIDKTL